MKEITRRLFITTSSALVANSGHANAEPPRSVQLESAGALRSNTNVFLPETFGAKGDGISDDTHAIAAAIRAAGGSPVYLAQSYLCGDLHLSDEPVHLTGPGTFVQPLGKTVINLRRSLGEPISVPRISTIMIGPDAPVLPQSSDCVSRLHVEEISNLEQGDIILLSAKDTYPFCEGLSKELGYHVEVYKSEILPITGIGLDYSVKTNAKFEQGDIVRGSRSGALGVVMVAGDNGKLEDTLIFQKIAGKFETSEKLFVRDKEMGVVVSKAYLLTDHIIIDTYPSSTQLRRMTQSRFLVDGPSVRSDGDCDALVGAENRQPAFLIRGAINPTVRNFTIHSAWTRCWKIESCYMPNMDVFIERLPNNANLEEGGYGYGIEFCGSTSDGVARVNGGNCRHGFTTNIEWVDQSWLDNGFDYSKHDYYRTGNPKGNTVRDSILKNCFAEAFDTHWGDYFTRFENCQAKNPSGTQLYKTTSAGFKSRGFGTVYSGCVVDGATYGFLDASGTYDAGFTYKTVYENCRAANILGTGFSVNQKPVVPHQRSTLYRDCSFKGATRGLHSALQVGWAASSETDIELENCRAECFTHQPYRIGRKQNWIVRGFVADYRECPRIATAPGIYDSPNSIFIERQFLITNNQGLANPSSVIENRSDNFAVVEIRNSEVMGAERPLVVDIGKSVTKLIEREYGRLVLRRSGAPTKGQYQIGDKTVDPTPVAGGYLGFICIEAGSPGNWKGYGEIEK